MRLACHVDRPRSFSAAGAVIVVGLAASASVTQFGGPLALTLAKSLAPALETRIPLVALTPTTPVDGILVLGGAPRRVAAALKLAKRFPDATLILSGPGTREMALATKRLGASDRLIIDRRPKNTYENALYSHDLVQPSPNDTWIVVTSAIHMPRALGVFQAVGFPVLPWPIQDTPTSPEALSASVWHEVLGLVGYRLLGRTNALYPRFDAATDRCRPGECAIAAST